MVSTSGDVTSIDETRTAATVDHDCGARREGVRRRREVLRHTRGTDVDVVDGM